MKKLYNNPEDNTAYDLRVTMNTIYALVKRGLIVRFNWKEIVWTGWESSTMKFKLTNKGREEVLKYI